MRGIAVVLLLAGCSPGIAAPIDAAPIDAAPIDAAATDAEATDAVVRRDAGEPPRDAGADAAAPDAGPPRSAGCLEGDGLAEGEHGFALEGLDRRFVVRLPAAYSRDRAWPLLLALHPNGSSASYWDATSGPRNVRAAVRDEAILIVAEAIDGQWRDYAMPESTWAARIETELAYFDEVIGRARAGLCVREDAIFAIGFSGGGSFSGVLACRRDDVRAIAVGGSVIYFDEADCIGSSAAWVTIGTLELTAGRERFRDFFRDRARCDPTSVPAEPAPCVAYDGCDPATPVQYCQHPGDHVWPDFGTAAAWSFFASLL